MDRGWFGSKIFLLLLIAASLNLSACTSQEKRIEVEVIADFGPANRPEVQKKIAVPERSTVFEALTGCEGKERYLKGFLTAVAVGLILCSNV